MANFCYLYEIVFALDLLALIVAARGVLIDSKLTIENIFNNEKKHISDLLVYHCLLLKCFCQVSLIVVLKSMVLLSCFCNL